MLKNPKVLGLELSPINPDKIDSVDITKPFTISDKIDYKYLTMLAMKHQIIYAVDNSIDGPSSDEAQVLNSLTCSANYFTEQELAVSYALEKSTFNNDEFKIFPIFKVKVAPFTNEDALFKVMAVLSAKKYTDKSNVTDMPLNAISSYEYSDINRNSFFFNPKTAPKERKLVNKDLICTQGNFNDYYKLQPIQQALTFLCANQKIAEQKDTWLPPEITQTICRNIVGRR